MYELKCRGFFLSTFGEFHGSPPFTVEELVPAFRHWLLSEAVDDNILVRSGTINTSVANKLTEETLKKRWNYKSHQELVWPNVQLARTARMWGLAIVDHPVAARELRKVGVCNGRLVSQRYSVARVPQLICLFLLFSIIRMKNYILKRKMKVTLHVYEKPLQGSYERRDCEDGDTPQVRYFDLGVRDYPEPERSHLQQTLNRLKIAPNSERMSIIFDYFEGCAYKDDSCWDQLFHIIATHSGIAEGRIRIAYNVNKHALDQTESRERWEEMNQLRKCMGMRVILWSDYELSIADEVDEDGYVLSEIAQSEREKWNALPSTIRTIILMRYRRTPEMGAMTMDQIIEYMRGELSIEF